jgi:hypothetical protein
MLLTSNIFSNQAINDDEGITMHEYITVDELATRTTYAKETITRGHIARLLIEGIHFVRPFGGKKKLYIWENIEKEMLGGFNKVTAIPMARGGALNGTR